MSRILRNKIFKINGDKIIYKNDDTHGEKVEGNYIW